VDQKRALEGIAIIGMAGRMPAAPNLDVFWNNLANGVESRTVFSDEELVATLRRLNFDTALLKRPDYVKVGYVLDGVELFDPAFFGLSSREAELMDPQHRLFLECAWETLENAGYAPGPSSPRTGVFGGCSISQYLMVNLFDHVDFSNPAQPLQHLIANDKDYLTTRTSFLLDLKGPSVAVQSACSTSLVAVCLACDSLRDHQCDLAIAGGISIMLPQTSGYLYQEGNIYSPDGHCRPFDAKAAGTVFGSGVGLVALKRLEDAQADGDTILAVIKDAAVNNDGNRKIGYTAPNELAQAEVIATAHARAEIDAGTITYVEAHGTGTQLGDPIEIAALTRAFRKTTRKKSFCAIGSVKSNVGHLQAAAGIASLIKTVLAMNRKMLPPSLHYTRPNAAIDFDNSPFYVNTTLRPWDSDGPRRAGVSSFGMGGTNAHVILEEAPAVERDSAAPRDHYLLPLSAESDSALRELARRHETALAKNPDRLADVCFTAAVGRAHFNQRLAVVGADADSLREQLSALRRRDTAAASESHARLLDMADRYERHESVDWAALGPGRRVPLPTYPFERQRCWVEPASAPRHHTAEATHPLLGESVAATESEVRLPIARKRAAEAAEPVAVIGIGCRFPGGVTSPAAYWRLLCAGVDAITEVPSYRWDIDRVYDPNPATPTTIYSRCGGFLGPIEDFDAEFFGISPREAATLDPQQRLLLETSWEALEHAHLPTHQLFGSDAGVFIGISTLDHASNLRLFGDPLKTDAYYGTGNSMSGAAGRLSYTYGVKGPCMAVETACSSSLVAVHLACRSLLIGECSLALAGGVNLLLSPDNSIVFSRARMLSPDGRCKSFSDAADGYGRGEGCGVVVLERLSDALKNRRRILGLILGTAVNQDGASGGLTVPNGPSQQNVVRQALQRGGVDPARVGYVEAHGTGTTLGDPIEVNALGAMFGKHRSKADPLIIGTVKSNIGHLESAAGIAGLIKLTLSLQHGEIPASLHFDRPNRNIPWNELPVRVATALQPWPANGKGRVGGVSSFGFAGTNAHVVMEEAPTADAEPAEPELPCRLLTFSAKTAPALAELALAYERFFVGCPDADFANACSGANLGRTHFKHRMSVVASSPAEASRILADARTGQSPAGVATGQVAAGGAAKTAFLFTGQGSQYAGMGRQLYHTQPAFRAELDRCAAVLEPLLERPLLDVLFGDDDALLNQTAYTQPALFAIEYALAKLLESWGVRPAAVLGHSIGEYVAACVAGVCRLEDALQLVAARGRLMQSLPAGGAMIAVFADEQRLRAALDGMDADASIAAVNGPRHIVVSGRADMLEAALAPLASDGVRLKRLKVSHAFHSPLMEPIVVEFRGIAEQVRYSEPRIALISNVTGEPATKPASAEYWVDHLRQAVRFGDGMRTLHRKGFRIFVELGPQPTLLSMARSTLSSDDTLFVPTLRRGREALEQLFGALGSLYAAGANIDWQSFERGGTRPRTVLPTYPFQRTRHAFYDAEHALDDTAPARQTRARSKVVSLLESGNSSELIRLVEAAGGLQDADRTTIERVVRCLVEQHVEALPTGDCYRLEWREAAPEPAAPPRLGSVLIFGDAGGAGDALARELRARGRRCTIAYADAYALDGRDGEVLDPADPAAFATLVARADSPRDVVYLWGLDSTDSALTGLLHLAQALAGEAPSDTSLSVVTRNAVSAGANAAPVELSQAPLWGLGRVIAVEHAALWNGLVDLDGAATATLLADICNEPARGEQIAIRGGRRYVARLARVAALDERPIEIRPDATYLLAGGLGAIGLGLAKWLASKGARHLILTSRGGASEDALARLRELETMGVKVVSAAADLASEADMERLFADAAASLPPLRGIVHLAGVVDDGILLQQTPERFERVMAPKVRGAWNLHHLSAGLELDFFVLFSSVASLLGSPGQGNYAAANAYLDALAAHRQASALPALSINWGPWAEIGMAASLGAAYRERFENQGIRLLSPAQAFHTFGKLLRSAAAQVAVMPVDWSIVKRRFPIDSAPPVLADLVDRDPAERAGAGKYVEELKTAPEGDRVPMLATYLQQRLGAVLGLPQARLPAVDQGFSELGMDSLMILELKATLESDLRISFSAAMVFNYPTIAALSTHLGQELGLVEAPSDTDQKMASIEDDLAAIEVIRNSSDDELAALIARELEAHP